MRFKKASLVAASLLLSSLPALAADITFAWADDPNAPAGATLVSELSVVTVGVGDTAVLNDNGRSGMLNGFRGVGNFVKEGSGILRNDGYWLGGDPHAPARQGLYGAESDQPKARDGYLSGPVFIDEPVVVGTITLPVAMSGSITVRGGTMELSGRVNQWVEVPGNMFTNRVGGSLAWMTRNAYMAGVSGITLESGTRLTFTNTGLNTANVLHSSLGGTGNGQVALRYNAVRNIKAGADNTAVDTVFEAGADNTYRIVIYSDNTASAVASNPALAALGAAGNSIGTISGKGNVFKYGAADLKILGESERGIGSFTIADGSVTLASAGGAALATASSVNLAGTDSRQGDATKAQYKGNPGTANGAGNDFWQAATAPSSGVGKLVVLNNQTLRNLQADFAYRGTGATVSAAVGNAASKTNAGEAVIAGTGKGSLIDIGANTLTIHQDRDGVYRGNVDASAGATLVKKGNATLALLLGIATNASIRVEEGTLLANAQGLGTSEISVTGGSLSVFQDNAGTLLAHLTGDSALNVIASAYLNNGAGQVQLNETGQGGTLLFGRRQDDFTGAVHAYDGVTLEFTSLVNDAMRTASSVVLHATSSGTTTLRVSDGVQNINRVSGDLGTRLDLGRGTLVARQAGEALEFGGSVIGAGTLIQSGGTWTLSGAQVMNTGALIVRDASTLNINGGSPTQLSGLVLSGDSQIKAAGVNMAVGALFGQTGSVVDLGGGTLTVGLSAERIAQLNEELGLGTLLSSNYLGTSATAVDLNGAPIGSLVDTVAVTAGRTLSGGSVLRSGQVLPVGLVLPAGTVLSGVAAANYEVRTDGSILIKTNTTLPADITLSADMVVNVSMTLRSGAATVAAATTAFLADTAGFDVNSAASLSFAGDIRGTGGLTKRAGETLTLTGVNTYTGATRLEGGALRVNWNSINATSGVTLYTGTTLEINADAASGDGEFTRSLTSVTDAAGNPIAGAGLVRKVGAGRVILTGDLSGFLGGFDVAAGTLQVNDAGNLSGTVDIKSGATMVFNQNVSATATGAVTNAGVLEKQGSGSLTLGAYSGAGQVNVRAGTLALTNFPTGGLDVSEGATFSSTISGTVTSSTVVTGTGTVSLSGSGTGPTLVAGAADLFKTVTLDLRNGITFDLNISTQTLGGFSGDETSSIMLNAGTLAFDTDADVNTVFIGNVTGAGAIVKSGAGTVTLGTTTVQNWTGTVTVNAGTLVATPQALGGQNSTNAVTLVTSGATYGTFALHNADTTSAQVYGGSVGGQGVLAKTGAGEVVFNQGLSGFTSPASGVAAVQVREGRLTTGDLGSDAVFTSVSVAQGASLRVNMSGARVLDASVADTLRGEGDLVVAGSQTLTLANGQNYTGLTELLDGATLAFSNTPVIHGIKGDAGTTIALSGDLRVNQAVSAAFSGVFSGSGTLTVGGAGTLDLSLAGASGDLAGLSLAVASGGTVRVGAANTQAIVNDGTLEITDSGAVSARYVAAVSGSGLVTKVGAGKLSFGDGVTSGVTGHPYVLGSTGGLLVKEGVLGGCFEVRGGLAVASGATLSPGNSPGVVTVATGDFNLAAGSTLLVEVNALTSDKVEVLSGAAILAGKLRVTQDSTAGSAKAAGGQKFTVVSATGGFTGAFSNSTNGFVFLDAADKVATGLDRVHLDKVGNNLVMTAVAGLSDIDGFAPHDGLGGFIAMLDAKGAPVSVQTAVDTLWGAGINSALTNLSPLGYAAEYAMAQDGEARRQALLHDRMEQRRYDRGSPLTTEDAPWEAFVVGGGSFVNNKAATDTPVFDYRTFGGLVGLDCKTADGLLLGAAIGYDSGKSTLKDNGGKVDMDRMAATLFMSTQLTSRWYLDVGATAGVGLYDSKRTTVAGNAEGDNVGFSGGLTAETGTVIALSKELHLTPYLAAVYTHHEFGSIDETGSDAALNVDSWSQDSLRAKVGTGLGWFLPTDWARLKLGLDVAYAHELLDTESKFGARFASAPGSKFDATAAALPKDSISLSPSLGLQFDESTSATLSYTYEMGLDSRSYQSVNFAIRKRF